MTTTIYNALCACLGLSPSSAQALSLIRQAYTEPENTPQLARSADVIYWSLSPEQDTDLASYNETAAASGSHKPTVHRYLPYQLLIVCYGPGCEAYAHKIRSFLYLDGAGLPRQILRKAGIYPVPDPPAPQLLYEPEASLWRRRADLTISLRIKDTLIYSASRNSITTAPAVIIVFMQYIPRSEQYYTDTSGGGGASTGSSVSSTRKTQNNSSTKKNTGTKAAASTVSSAAASAVSGALATVLGRAGIRVKSEE